MALEWLKDKADKAVKAAGEVGTALSSEAHSIEQKLLGSSDPKNSADTKAATDIKAPAADAKAAPSGDAKTAPTADAKAAPKAADAPASTAQTAASASAKSDTSLTIPTLSELTSDKTLQNAALNAVAREKGLPESATPKHDGLVLDAVSDNASKSLITTATSSIFGYLSSPLAAIYQAGKTLGSELVKVAENVYETSDKSIKLTVEKVAGTAADELKKEYNKLFDDDSSSTKPAPAKIEFNNIFDAVKPKDQPAVSRVSDTDDTSKLPQDMMHWFYDKNEKAPGSDNLFSTVNSKMEKTDISAEPGHVHIEKRDSSGKVETIVDKSDGRTMVLHGNESVVIENGKEVVKGDGYTVSWDEQGKRHISLASGSEVIRDGEHVKITDKLGGALDIQKHLMTIAGNFAFIDSPDHLKELTEQKRQGLHEGQVAVIAIKDAGVRTIFADGSTFDVQNDHARLETADHKVFQFELKDNKLFLRKDKQLVPFDEKDCSLVKAENGKFKIGKLVIDPVALCVDTVSTPDKTKPTSAADKSKPILELMHLDLINNLVLLRDSSGKDWTAKVDKDNSTVLTDVSENKTYQNNSHDSTVTVTTPTTKIDPLSPDAPKPEVLKIDLATTNLDLNDKIVDTPQDTTIKDTHTVIDNDRTVHLGGEDGPTVHPDGSVRVDRETSVDADMTVHSGDWTSSAAKSSSSSSSSSNSNSNSDGNAQTAAASASSRASSVSGVAKGGIVRWSQVAQLNSALGDVLSLMGTIPTDSQAYALLIASYGQLVDAINEATPKAEATENAMQKGINSPDAIKAIEDGGSDNDQLKSNRLAA